MGITKDFKLTAVFTIVFLMMLSASIYKDKLVLFSAAILGTVVLFFLLNNPVQLIYIQVFYSCLIKFAIWTLHVPSYANYVTDILNILIFFAAIKAIINSEQKPNVLLPMSIAIVFFLTTVLGLIINGQSIFLYIWGLRIVFRFYIFFFGCAVLLQKKDFDNIFKIMIFLSFINFGFCIIQYFVFGIKIDNLGGIFGTIVGVDTYLNIFLCCINIIALVKYKAQKMSSLLTLFIVVSSIIISALGELKIFYIELLIFILGILFFSKVNKKTILIAASGVLCFFVGIELLYIIFPKWNGFFTIQNIIASGQVYSTPTDLGRFNATTKISNMFFSGDVLKYTFGIGLGSAQTSQFSYFNSPFYIEYGELLHYTWFSDAFVLLENGWLGLICFFSFFISIFYSCTKIKKKNNENIDFCIISQIFAVVCCVLCIYNSTFQTEAGYMAYFMLSLPYVLDKGDKLWKTD